MADPLWSDVILAIEPQGTDGSTTILDVSDTARTITAGGTADLTNVNQPWPGTFPDILSVDLRTEDGWLVMTGSQATYAFGTSDFCIEFRFRTTHNGVMTFVDTYDSTVSTSWQIYNFGGSSFGWYTDGGAQFSAAVPGGDTIDGNWHHVAAQRVSGTLTLYYDGVAFASASETSNFGTSGTPLTFGRQQSDGTAHVQGQMCQMRITLAERYVDTAGTITVPDQPFEIGPVSSGSTINSATGTSTTSTLTGSSVAEADITSASGSSTTSTLTGSSTAVSTINAATGTSTTSTLTGSARITATISPASGSSTTSTLSASSTASSAISPASSTSTTSTLTSTALAVASFVAAAGVSITSTLIGSDGSIPPSPSASTFRPVFRPRRR